MGYIVIHQDGSYERRWREPSYDDLRQLVRAERQDHSALVERVSVGAPGVTLWVNEDFQSLTHAGLLERNQIGTAAALDLGASRQPYAGTIVVTGATQTLMDGWVPQALDSDMIDAVSNLLDALRIIAGLEEGEERYALPPEHVALARERLEVYREPWPAQEIFSFESPEEAIRFITGGRG